MFTDTWDSQGPMYTELGRIFMFHVLQWNLKSRLEIKKTDSNSFPNPNWQKCNVFFNSSLIVEETETIDWGMPIISFSK